MQRLKDGLKLTWDSASTRVKGFEIMALAQLGRLRVDVTLREIVERLSETMEHGM